MISNKHHLYFKLNSKLKQSNQLEALKGGCVKHEVTMQVCEVTWHLITAPLQNCQKNCNNRKATFLPVLFPKWAEKDVLMHKAISFSKMLNEKLGFLRPLRFKVMLQGLFTLWKIKSSKKLSEDHTSVKKLWANIHPRYILAKLLKPRKKHEWN